MLLCNAKIVRKCPYYHITKKNDSNYRTNESLSSIENQWTDSTNMRHAARIATNAQCKY